jgi:hypothetical protein
VARPVARPVPELQYEEGMARWQGERKGKARHWLGRDLLRTRGEESPGVVRRQDEDGGMAGRGEESSRKGEVSGKQR